MIAFSWWDILIFFTFSLSLLYYHRFVKPLLKGQSNIHLTTSIFMMPLLLVVIYLLAWMTYRINIFPYLIYLGSAYLGVDLYEYIKKINRFEMVKYFPRAVNKIYILFCFFTFSMVIVRFLTLFFK